MRKGKRQAFFHALQEYPICAMPDAFGTLLQLLLEEHQAALDEIQLFKGQAARAAFSAVKSLGK